MFAQLKQSNVFKKIKYWTFTGVLSSVLLHYDFFFIILLAENVLNESCLGETLFQITSVSAVDLQPHEIISSATSVAC